MSLSSSQRKNTTQEVEDASEIDLEDQEIVLEDEDEEQELEDEFDLHKSLPQYNSKVSDGTYEELMKSEIDNYLR